MISRQKNSVSAKRLAAVFVVGAALFGAAGCSGGGASPGTAFIVNGTAMSERELTEATDQLASIGGGEAYRAQAAQTLATSEAILDALAEGGIAPTEQEIETQAEAFLALTGSSTTADELLPAVRRLLYVNALLSDPAISDEVGAELVQQAIATADLNMNPRYESQ